MQLSPQRVHTREAAPPLSDTTRTRHHTREAPPTPSHTVHTPPTCHASCSSSNWEMQSENNQKKTIPLKIRNTSGIKEMNESRKHLLLTHLLCHHHWTRKPQHRPDSAPDCVQNHGTCLPTPQQGTCLPTAPAPTAPAPPSMAPAPHSTLPQAPPSRCLPPCRHPRLQEGQPQSLHKLHPQLPQQGLVALGEFAVIEAPEDGGSCKQEPDSAWGGLQASSDCTTCVPEANSRLHRGLEAGDITETPIIPNCEPRAAGVEPTQLPCCEATAVEVRRAGANLKGGSTHKGPTSHRHTAATETTQAMGMLQPQRPHRPWARCSHRDHTGHGHAAATETMQATGTLRLGRTHRFLWLALFFRGNHSVSCSNDNSRTRG